MTVDLSQQPEINNEDDEVEMIVIPPRTDLREKALRDGSASNASKKAIKAAEEAIDELSGEFEDWMKEAIANLLEKIPAIEEHGLNSPSGEELHTIAHDLKGQATTLGYPVVSEICETLSNLIEKAPDKSRISPKIVEIHIKAIETIVHECTKNVDDPKANAISSSLRKMVMKILNEEYEKQAVQA